MRKLLTFVPSAAVFLISAGLQISGYTNRGAAIACVLVAVALLSLPAFAYLGNARRWSERLRGWRVQPPLTRSLPEFTPQRFYLARCLVDFGTAQHSTFKVTFVVYNSTSRPVSVDTVDGWTTYPGLNPDPPMPLAWQRDNDPILFPPFGRGAITIVQPTPPGAQQRMFDILASRQAFSIDFTHVRVRLRSAAGETLQMRLWDGVSCSFADVPVPTGELINLVVNEVVSATATASARGGA